MKNRIAFITGGNKGIGRSTVIKLSKELKYVYFTYNSDVESAKEVSKLCPNSIAIHCNLGDTNKIQEIANNIISNDVIIDILINNAGYDNDSTFLKMNVEAWNEVIDINLKSVFHFTKYFLGGMIDNQWGRIINISSIAAATGAYGKSNYSAAKAGLLGFTKSLALEMASKNITVNAISPGAIDTDMFNRIPEKYREAIIKNIPMKRLGEPIEVANLIKFLVSDESSYITGQNIHVNGGSYLE